jgi:hypothetical protein
MRTTTAPPPIRSRGDIDDILTDIEYHAEQMVEEARLDVSLSISQVFEAHERADELLANVRALESLVMLPIDLYEEVWSALEAANALTNNAPNVTPSTWMDVARLACEALDTLTGYTIR